MAADSSAGGDAAAWRRVLRLLLRRFGGRLQLRGRLLNPRELLVLQLRRVEATGAPLGAAVRVPKPLALRIGVRGADDAPERVGRDDVVALARPPYGGGAETEADVLPESAALEWEEGDAQLLTALDSDSLFGFDVRALLQLSAAAQLPEESAAAPNAVLASAPAFSDLRCTQLLLRQTCGAEWLQTHRALQSFVTAARPLVASEAHPRSYVSLGAAQKRRWADERFECGKELVAKRRLKDAVAEFTSCLQLEETHANALFARGEAHAALQQFAEAVGDFEAVRTLDSAFAGLDDALLRARGKQRHSQRVDLRSSESLVAAGTGAKSPVREAAPKREADDHRRRSHSHSRSSASGDPRKKLETERLRRLLEAEVGAKREKHERHRRRRERSAGDADASDSDARSRRAKKAKKRKKKTNKRHKRRRRDDSDDSDDSGAQQRSSRKRSRSRSRRRHRSRSSCESRKRSEHGRPETRSASPAAPHRIISPQRQHI